MSVQTFATRSTDKINARARQSAHDTLDASTEQTVRDAVRASQRARAILRDAERFLSHE